MTVFMQKGEAGGLITAIQRVIKGNIINRKRISQAARVIYVIVGDRSYMAYRQETPRDGPSAACQPLYPSL